ncbi:MAG: S41 family peptidase [Trueperaceae bacterium]|nr:MAG: S41 family peptidase [Trueperaceae bacterium]
MRRRWLLLAAVGLGLFVVVVHAQFSRDFTDEFLRNPTGRAFMQTYGALMTSYLDDVDEQQIIQGAIDGMIEALEDPYSYYKTPTLAADDLRDQAGSFEGIGAVLTPRDRETGAGVEILTVYRDGPAWNAGLKRGDIFLEVDGVNVAESTPSEVAELVRGPKGTEVSLLMQRPGVVDFVSFDIKRGTIEIFAVESTILPNNVGYISLSTFANQRLHDQLVDQLESLERDGINSLVLDLRDNGGGFLNQGILVADEFLSSGDIVFQRARGVTQRLASAQPPAFDLPMVVLVNENSASASEIVAGALQENGRAIVIGEETFGKGVAQNVISLSDGGQLVYLAFEWLTPNRRSINQQGIEPDISAEDTRFPRIIGVEGQGAAEGQQVEIFIDGELVGTSTVDEEGEFRFISSIAPREYSEVQGEALVDFENDSLLQIAHQQLLEQVAASAN